jgi:hypothetical protein
MSATTERHTFRALVADVAARAKARLPEAVNGRVEAAAKLVLLNDVTPQEDGTILVGSSSDPGTQYRLVGDTCECQDWRHGKAPGGWCQHRIAAGIQKRVGEVLAKPEDYPAPEVVQPAYNLPEAPASINVRLEIGGRECQLTLRDTSETRLLERLQAVLEHYPAPHQSQPQDRGKDWCQIHKVTMQENHKDGQTWYSHKVDGQWCKGR